MNTKISVLGFTLIEMMVVVAILTILVSISTPRLYRFIAKSRQSEAKTNLGIIHTLQEAYLLDKDTYFDPGVGKPLARGSKYGYRGGGDNTSGCTGSYFENKLGFILMNCGETRYGYTMAATAGDFSVSAHAPSDDKRWLYPRCIGSTASTPVSCDGGLSAGLSGAPASLGAPQVQGDAWCIDPDRKLDNYVDIIENCAGQ